MDFIPTEKAPSAMIDQTCTSEKRERQGSSTQLIRDSDIASYPTVSYVVRHISSLVSWDESSRSVPSQRWTMLVKTTGSHLPSESLPRASAAIIWYRNSKYPSPLTSMHRCKERRIDSVAPQSSVRAVASSAVTVMRQRQSKVRDITSSAVTS